MEDFFSFFWFCNVYSAASLCCAVSVVIMGFYLFPWHMDEGFHRAFVAFHTISSCLCVALRHEFGAEGRISPWPESAPHHPTAPLYFPFVSVSLFSFFSSFCIFLPAPQHCSLVFTYSLIQNNKLELYSLQPACFSFSLLNSAFPPLQMLFLLSLVALTTSLWAQIRECGQQRKLNDTLKMVLLGGNDVVTVTMCHSSEMVRYVGRPFSEGCSFWKVLPWTLCSRSRNLPAL